MKNYKGDSIIAEHIVHIECIQKAVLNLSNGKAAGYDLLTAEHLKFCHPIVLSCLTKLFFMMLKFSYVPHMFGVGITVPLPKADVRGLAFTSDA